MNLSHNTPVTFKDFRGQSKEGAIIGRKQGSHYWVRVRENILPGFNTLDRVQLKHRFKLDVVPDFSNYDAWVNENDIKVRDEGGEG